MTTVQHTPGPWRLVGADNGRIQLQTRQFRLTGADYHIGTLVLTAAAPAADARLITAAPDLLAACRDALSWINDETNDQGNSVTRRLAAVIAKATGSECT